MTNNDLPETLNPGERMVLTIREAEFPFRWCPAGTFMMGRPRSEGRSGGETQRPVTLAEGFWMLETPVTQEMWERVMGKNPSCFKGKSLPVEQVSWKDCQAYIRKLNDLNAACAGYGFSLPTEAQWEYACRAGTQTTFHFGDVLNGDKANCDGSFPYGTLIAGKCLGKTTKVGAYPANAWGLHDMHGNVWEWCLDKKEPSDKSSQALRGGSWLSDPAICQSANRLLNMPSYKSNCIGFRLAMVAGSCRPPGGMAAGNET